MRQIKLLRVIIYGIFIFLALWTLANLVSHFRNLIFHQGIGSHPFTIMKDFFWNYFWLLAFGIVAFKLADGKHDKKEC